MWWTLYLTNTSNRGYPGYSRQIPVADALRRNGITVKTNVSQLCEKLTETTNHLIVECEFTKTIRYCIFRRCGIKNSNTQINDNFFKMTRIFPVKTADFIIPQTYK
ncbi:hypothetical protein LXL04_030244 [Taraxacum kok-saghyz]